MKSPLRESYPEMHLHVVKEERALGVKQGPSFSGMGLGYYKGLETGLLQHKSSLYFPYQQSVPDSGVGCTDPGLVERNRLLANKGKASRNLRQWPAGHLA